MTDGPTEVVVIDQQLKELIPMFFSETEDDFRRLQESFIRGDFQAITEIAHTLKGECGGYGFVHLGRLATELEAAALKESTQQTRAFISEMVTHLSTVNIQYTGDK